MDIKTQEPVRVLFTTVKTSLKNLHQDVGQTPEKLYEAAAKANLIPAGGQYWRYLDANENPDTIFALDMALPIHGEGQPETFGIKEYPAFKYVSTVHLGTWDTMGATYGKIIGELKMSGLNMTNECREVYHVVDDAHPENNSTEIQIGIL